MQTSLTEVALYKLKKNGTLILLAEKLKLMNETTLTLTLHKMSRPLWTTPEEHERGDLLTVDGTTWELPFWPS